MKIIFVNVIVFLSITLLYSNENGCSNQLNKKENLEYLDIQDYHAIKIILARKSTSESLQWQKIIFLVAKLVEYFNNNENNLTASQFSNDLKKTVDLLKEAYFFVRNDSTLHMIMMPNKSIIQEPTLIYEEAIMIEILFHLSDVTGEGNKKKIAHLISGISHAWYNNAWYAIKKLNNVLQEIFFLSSGKTSIAIDTYTV